MEQQLFDLGYQAYQSVLNFRPVEYDSAGISFTWNVFTVIVALALIGIVATRYRNQYVRKELRALKDLLCARKRLSTQLEALYTHAFANELVKAQLKDRHKKRMTNGHDKPLPDGKKPPSDFQSFFQSLRVTG